jgi:hypothetical protein
MNQSRHVTLRFGMIGLAAAVVLWSGAVTYADVSIKQTTTTKGLAGILDAEVKSENCIQGDRNCTEAQTRFTSKLMKFATGGKATKTSSIARLDKDLVWEVNHQDKSYTEMTFAQMRAMMDSLKTMMAGGPMGGTPAKTEIDTSEVTYAPPKFDVKKTGLKETIAGYPCEQTILTMTVEGTNKKTGEKFQMLTTMDMMMAQDVPGRDEYEQFGRKMAEKMGLGMDAASAQSMMSALGAYGIDAKKLAEESAKLKGFPMRQVVTFAGQGKQFASSETTQKGENGEKESAEEEKSGGNDVAAKALGSLFGKKKSDKKKAGEGKSAEKPDDAIFKMTTEVTEISTGAVPATRFEVPAGYKLKPAGKK